jgi:hypothetical protein
VQALGNGERCLSGLFEAGEELEHGLFRSGGSVMRSAGLMWVIPKQLLAWLGAEARVLEEARSFHEASIITSDRFSAFLHAVDRAMTSPYRPNGTLDSTCLHMQLSFLTKTASSGTEFVTPEC